MKKHSPTYSLTVRYQDPRKSDAFTWETINISSPFTRWFSADGQFVAKPFQEWLASEIPMVGAAKQVFASDRAISQSQEVSEQRDKKIKEKGSLSTEGLAARSRKVKR